MTTTDALVAAAFAILTALAFATVVLGVLATLRISRPDEPAPAPARRPVRRTPTPARRPGPDPDCPDPAPRIPA
ncbi:hypothetical protein [Kitasatospora sp. NPDC093806]|uniref:hypothetical protein n=1 Tax=Kitasatospora sp. NPDC093806 TaxID=3155075 RepID=UPI00343A59FF